MRARGGRGTEARAAEIRADEWGSGKVGEGPAVPIGQREVVEDARAALGLRTYRSAEASLADMACTLLDLSPE